MKPNSVIAATAALATPTVVLLKLCAAMSQNATPRADVIRVVPTIDPALVSSERLDRAASRTCALRFVQLAGRLIRTSVPTWSR
jgi:hypothetical protein